MGLPLWPEGATPADQAPPATYDTSWGEWEEQEALEEEGDIDEDGDFGMGGDEGEDENGRLEEIAAKIARCKEELEKLQQRKDKDRPKKPQQQDKGRPKDGGRPAAGA